MYRRPHRIWVRALFRQSGPALAILDPGTAWGMPSAPEYGFIAWTFQPLSLFHSRFRYGNWRVDQWNLLSIFQAICFGVGFGFALPPPLEPPLTEGLADWAEENASRATGRTAPDWILAAAAWPTVAAVGPVPADQEPTSPPVMAIRARVGPLTTSLSLNERALLGDKTSLRSGALRRSLSPWAPAIPS